MDIIEIGKYIKNKRSELHMTQKDLARRLNLSFQTVSKWETGVTLPVTTVLQQLSDVLEVSIDQILSAGEFRKRMNKKVNVEEITEAIKSIVRLKDILGPNNGLYKSMIKGINKDTQVDFEDAVTDPKVIEVLIAQSCIQLLFDGYTMTEEDVHKFFKSEEVKEKLLLYVKKYSN